MLDILLIHEADDVFSACKDIMLEVSRREKEAGIVPDPDIDTYMKVPFLDFLGAFLSLFMNFIRLVRYGKLVK